MWVGSRWGSAGQRLAVALWALLALLVACSSETATSEPSSAFGAAISSPPRSSAPGEVAASDTVPAFDHVVIVVLENHAYSQLIGNAAAPFLNSLIGSGAVLTQSYAVSHPSQPNYLALFSGSTQGLTDDSCPHSFDGPNLAASLIASGRSFIGYSEDLPATGYTGCASAHYVRKHNPWADFPALPRTVNQPMTAFPTDFARLPTVAFVIPNLAHDMHDGTIAQSDTWLNAHLSAYVRWAQAHNSALIVTADEDDHAHNNRIATIITGAHIQRGANPTPTTHYGLLRTLLAASRLAPFGQTITVPPLTTSWTR